MWDKDQICHLLIIIQNLYAEHMKHVESSLWKTFIFSMNTLFLTQSYTKSSHKAGTGTSWYRRSSSPAQISSESWVGIVVFFCFVFFIKSDKITSTMFAFLCFPHESWSDLLIGFLAMFYNCIQIHTNNRNSVKMSFFFFLSLRVWL